MSSVTPRAVDAGHGSSRKSRDPEKRFSLGQEADVMRVDLTDVTPPRLSISQSHSDVAKHLADSFLDLGGEHATSPLSSISGWAERVADLRCGGNVGLRIEVSRNPRHDRFSREVGIVDPLDVNGEDVEVELVTLRICHTTPTEAFQFSGRSRLKPSASELLDLCGGVVEVLDDEVQVHPVLSRLHLRHPLEPHGEAIVGRRQDEKITVSDGGVHLNAKQPAPERSQTIRVDRVNG
jgi:hypothetical protein